MTEIEYILKSRITQQREIIQIQHKLIEKLFAVFRIATSINEIEKEGE